MSVDIEEIAFIAVWVFAIVAFLGATQDYLTYSEATAVIALMCVNMVGLK